MRYNSTRRIAPPICLTLALVALSPLTARAQVGAATTAPAGVDPRASINKLQQAAQRGGAKCYIRDFGGGKRRLVFNSCTRQGMQAIAGAVGRGTNVLQICHVNKPGLQHTLAIWDGDHPHFQTPDQFRSWRLNRWGPLYHNTQRHIFSAMIQLSPSEGERMRTLFAEARQQQQGGQRVITSPWGRGNCASIWTNLPIGDQGQTLGQLIGIGSNGSPRGLQQALEARANERVFAVGAYGAPLANFGQNPAANIVNFR